MTYNAIELSEEAGAPFYLYEFITNDSVYRFNSITGVVIYNTFTWTPVPIHHTKVNQSDELSKNAIRVTIPLAHPDVVEFYNIFRGWAPNFQVSVNIYRGHIGEPEVLIFWKGRVQSANVKNNHIEISCESVFTSMKRPGVRARYMLTCRHTIYNRGCNVVKALHEFIDTVYAKSANTLSITGASAEANNWYRGGFIEFQDGSKTMIISHIANNIILDRANRYLEETYPVTGYGLNYGNFYGGMKLILYPGCNKTLSTCETKFNNLPNNGAFPFIPTKNPFGGSTIQ